MMAVFAPDEDRAPGLPPEMESTASGELLPQLSTPLRDIEIVCAETLTQIPQDLSWAPFAQTALGALRDRSRTLLGDLSAYHPDSRFNAPDALAYFETEVFELIRGLHGFLTHPAWQTLTDQPAWALAFHAQANAAFGQFVSIVHRAIPTDAREPALEQLLTTAQRWVDSRETSSPNAPKPLRLEVREFKRVDAEIETLRAFIPRRLERRSGNNRSLVEDRLDELQGFARQALATIAEDPAQAPTLLAILQARLKSASAQFLDGIHAYTSTAKHARVTPQYVLRIQAGLRALGETLQSPDGVTEFRAQEHLEESLSVELTDWAQKGVAPHAVPWCHEDNGLSMDGVTEFLVSEDFPAIAGTADEALLSRHAELLQARSVPPSPETQALIDAIQAHLERLAPALKTATSQEIAQAIRAIRACDSAALTRYDDGAFLNHLGRLQAVLVDLEDQVSGLFASSDFAQTPTRRNAAVANEARTLSPDFLPQQRRRTATLYIMALQYAVSALAYLNRLHEQQASSGLLHVSSMSKPLQTGALALLKAYRTLFSDPDGGLPDSLHPTALPAFAERYLSLPHEQAADLDVETIFEPDAALTIAAPMMISEEGDLMDSDTPPRVAPATYQLDRGFPVPPTESAPSPVQEARAPEMPALNVAFNPEWMTPTARADHQARLGLGDPELSADPLTSPRQAAAPRVEIEKGMEPTPNVVPTPPATVEQAQAGVLTRFSRWFNGLSRTTRVTVAAATAAIGLGISAASLSESQPIPQAPSADVSTMAQAPQPMAPSEAQAPTPPSAPSAKPTDNSSLSAALASSGIDPDQVPQTLHTQLATPEVSGSIQEYSSILTQGNLSNAALFAHIKADLLSKGGFEGAFGLSTEHPDLAPLAQATTAGEYFELAKRLKLDSAFQRRMLGTIGAYGLTGSEVGQVAQLIVKNTP